MDAIDWPALARGVLWVFGLSVSLAALSHVRWAAKRSGVPLRIAVGWDSFLAPFFAGLVLFAAGMAWGARRLWETLAWAVLTALFAWQAALALRDARAASHMAGASAADAAAPGAGAKENAHETTQ
ncbi:MAG: hypothetical protein ACM30E_11665 [Nitrososphaerales archaeon]